MRRFLATVLCGFFAAAASASFVDGQQFTAQRDGGAATGETAYYATNETVYYATNETVRATNEAVYATNETAVHAANEKVHAANETVHAENEAVVHVGFMMAESSETHDGESEQYAAALETDGLLTGVCVAPCSVKELGGNHRFVV